jgi:hypothetical protein
VSERDIAFRVIVLILFTGTFLSCWIKSLEQRVRQLEAESEKGVVQDE